MIIIDANNLAGKLGLLNQKHFDSLLIGKIQKWNFNRNKKITLVFDGADVMGNKYARGNITVMHSPRDSYYKSADDRILELINKNANEVVLITDDNDLIEKALKLKGKNAKPTIKKATEFAKELADNYVSEDEELSVDEINNINEELLRLWK